MILQSHVHRVFGNHALLRMSPFGRLKNPCIHLSLSSKGFKTHTTCWFDGYLMLEVFPRFLKEYMIITFKLYFIMNSYTKYALRPLLCVKEAWNWV
jgi:hypothetical protein